MKHIKRLWCRLFTHDWRQPFAYGTDVFGVLWRTQCDRCGAQIGGDWEFMDEHGAWAWGSAR